jgi:predicted nucleic acid-binding protein
VEIASALVRRWREGVLPAAERDRALAALRADMDALYVVEVSPDVTRLAVELLARQELRAGDAIQLAACLYLAERVGTPVRFVAYDRRLVEAARREGLAT